MGVPKLAEAPHKLLTLPHKHGSYRSINTKDQSNQIISGHKYEDTDKHTSPFNFPDDDGECPLALSDCQLAIAGLLVTLLMGDSTMILSSDTTFLQCYHDTIIAVL